MRILTSIFLCAVLFSSCRSHEYYDKLDAELASGARYDSLFLDINFGMTQKEFYAHCWELNKQRQVSNGSNNSSVLYKLDDELSHPADMNFYPEFYEGKIVKMPVVISYNAWAPWNEELNADHLVKDVLVLFKKWYGDDFMTISAENRGTAYVKIDGNRRISIYKKNESQVEVLFTDLLIEKELKKNI